MITKVHENFLYAKEVHYLDSISFVLKDLDLINKIRLDIK